MKIALVHEHLISDGGGERVLKAFAELWPEAPIYTLLFDPEKTHSFFNTKQIQTSYLQQLPLKSSKYQWYLPLRPRAIESFNFNGFDVVLSNSSSLIKGIKTTGALHIDYCHTPTRYLWVDPDKQLDPLEGYWPVSQMIKKYKKLLQAWDLSAASQVDIFIANSENVRQRIKKYYNRESAVFYPPVDTHSFDVSSQQDDYFLVGGRITSYKRFDIVIEAFNRLLIPLKVFGVGPWLKKVKQKAAGHIEFLGAITDEDKKKLFARAQAFVYPQIEDFGITAIESMAAGRPVIAYRAGGVLETVVDGKTGIFFDDHDWASLSDAVIRFNSKDFDPVAIKAHAEKFSVGNFKQNIQQVVNSAWRTRAQ